MKTLSPVELQKILSESPNATVIDVRTPVEFAEVHVPQAKSIPLDELNTETVLRDKTQPVYLLCRSGQRATKAAEKLAKANYSQPMVIEGGTLAWIDAGLPVTRGTTKVISLERQVRIAAGSLVFIGVLLGWFVNRWFFGLSGFIGAGLVFAGITDFCGMGLLLAKAPWNRKV
jgi:rhodanese-related sulfurtransferase